MLGSALAAEFSLSSASSFASRFLRRLRSRAVSRRLPRRRSELAFRDRGLRGSATGSSCAGRSAGTIADVDVGKNIGAELETDRAEADKKIAQAKAEERRAMAYAAEQEMKARVEEMRAKVVAAEAEIPLAMSEAFRKGQLGIMDYYRMKNIMADTQMRDKIGSPEEKERQE